MLKSGNCEHKFPYSLPPKYADIVARAVQEMGIDFAHVEGCFRNENLRIFDINPYPTSNGSTLIKMTEDIVSVILEKLI